jgi:hypothetical protein
MWAPIGFVPGRTRSDFLALFLDLGVFKPDGRVWYAFEVERISGGLIWFVELEAKTEPI